MLHRREILTAAGKSFSALPRQSLNNQEAVVDRYSVQVEHVVRLTLSLNKLFHMWRLVW